MLRKGNRMVHATYIGDGVYDIDSLAWRLDFVDASSFRGNIVWDEANLQYVIVNE